MSIPNRLLALVVVVALAATASRTAAAKGKPERAAERAMNELFSSAQFEEAKAALEKTIAECDRCSKHTLAILHGDLAIVLITGLRDSSKGAAEMRIARAQDPGFTLDPAFVTEEVQAAFDAAGGGKPSPLEKEVVLEDEPEQRPKSKRHHVEEEEEAREPECTSSADCQGGAACKAGTCVMPPPHHDRSAWLSVGLIQDFPFVSGTDLCTEKSQVNSGNTCLRASGSQYHGTPIAGQAGKLGLTPSAGPTRLTLATYFALSTQLSGGFRVGYAIAGSAPAPDGGKTFLPIHAEVQLAYWLSRRALSNERVGTFIEASTGIAQMVGNGSATIHENQTVPPPLGQLNNPPIQKVDIYQNSGFGFVGAGAGLFIPFGGGSALIADVRLSAFLPTAGFAIGLGAGMAFGL
jgi:hypothetical protein